MNVGRGTIFGFQNDLPGGESFIPAVLTAVLGGLSPREEDLCNYYKLVDK